jgi:molybdopterin-guanine dinucleotide biosynthesis protein A
VISKEHNLPEKHKKHADLARPLNGNYNRNEWAIVGAPCEQIKQLAGQIIDALSPKYKCAYADTTHNDELNVLPGRLEKGAVLEYTDQINYQQLNYNTAFNPFKLRQAFADIDLVLVNGNHQQAKAQVVVIDNNKQASLRKRLSQLTNVQLFLLADNVNEVFDFVKEAVPNWKEIPVYRFDETGKIIAFFEAQMKKAKSVLNGLVLAGGKSQRMGFDKGALNWHGKEQRYYVADLLMPFCDEVYISCRENQQQDIEDGYLSIPDTFTGLGPYGAILSAFREKPDNAWLVVACDLPLLDENTLQFLTDNRNTSSIATAFNSGFDGFPEPLITIWEPKCYPVLLSFLAQGYSCPRKVLINSEATILKAPNINALTNVNTPQDMEQVKLALDKKMAAQ